MDTSTPPTKSVFKNPYLYSGIIFGAVICYLVVLFLYRYESNRDYQRHNAQKTAEQRREEDQAAIEQLGGSELSIRALYISPSLVRRGETAQLCYDVANAKTVTVDPPIGEVWPSHNRCLDVSPGKTTTYTLTITDAAGKTATQSVELQVR
ncbi:MAG: hypothetical protein WBR26_12235 [Candidatus Acidiferrum sp.]